MHGRSIDNIDNVNVRSWDTFILPRTFLDLLYDTVAVPGSVLIKRVLLREKGMEGLEKPGGYSCVLLISFKFRLTIVLSASCLLEKKKKQDQQPQLKTSSNTLLGSLIKHEHKPVTISKTFHVVHGVESTRVVEHVLDASECVQYLWNSGRHGSSVRVLISDLLLGQALLHLLGSEEGEAAVDRVL